jgi:hypothetical protein
MAGASRSCCPLRRHEFCSCRKFPGYFLFQSLSYFTERKNSTDSFLPSFVPDSPQFHAKIEIEVQAIGQILVHCGAAAENSAALICYLSDKLDISGFAQPEGGSYDDIRCAWQRSMKDDVS